jgi:hypothetical protein
MMDYCCEELRVMVEEYDGPFWRPISINSKSMGLKYRDIRVSLFNLTKSKKAISLKGRSAFSVRFCPACGKGLVNDE